MTQLNEGFLNEYFKRSEFACHCGCGFDTVDVELLSVLTDLREHFGAPVTINSACRCDSHNRVSRGKKSSKHLSGIAADIVVKGLSPQAVYEYLNNRYPNRYGLGNYKTFTHIDVRANKARWVG